MSRKKIACRFWTIADFAEEEIWLRKMHNQGWRLANFRCPAFTPLKAVSRRM